MAEHGQDRLEAELIDAYWTHFRLATSEERADRLAADESYWAWERVNDLVTERGRDVVPLLIKLADAVDGDVPALAFLGAGPVEYLLVTADDVTVDRVEGAANRNSNFCMALRCAWFDEDVDAGVARRLRRFGPPL